eukprot:g1057.t1
MMYHLAAVMAVACCVLNVPAEAHNWMNNPVTRVPTLTKAVPCPSKPDENFVSVVAKPGEPFPLEYTTGHGVANTEKGRVYMTIVRGGPNHMKDLRALSIADIDNYLADKAGQNLITHDKRLRKVHSRWWIEGRRSTLTPADAFKIQEESIESEIKKGDSDYIQHDESWQCHAMQPVCKDGKPYQKKLFRYKNSGTNKDIFVTVEDPKYPQIVGAGKFTIEFHKPSDHDIVHLMIPESAGEGDYVVQYHFRGYRDCIDVKVTKEEVTLKKESRIVKMNHCRYENFMTFGQVNEKVSGHLANDKCKLVLPGAAGEDAVKECTRICESERCDGVNVIPLRKPKGVRFAYNPALPQQCNLQNLLQQAGGKADSAKVCFPLKSRIPKPPLFLTYTIIDNDPADVTFHSTCYQS